MDAHFFGFIVTIAICLYVLRVFVGMGLTAIFKPLSGRGLFCICALLGIFIFFVPHIPSV